MVNKLAAEVAVETAKQIANRNLVNALILATVTTFITAGVGLLIWYIQKKLSAIGEKMIKSNSDVAKELAIKLEEKNECVDELRLVTLQGVGASLKLSVANAVAVRDGKCNGEMTAALKTANKAMLDTDEFIDKLTKKALYDIQHHRE